MQVSLQNDTVSIPSSMDTTFLDQPQSGSESLPPKSPFESGSKSLRPKRQLKNGFVKDSSNNNNNDDNDNDDDKIKKMAKKAKLENGSESLRPKSAFESGSESLCVKRLLDNGFVKYSDKSKKKAKTVKRVKLGDVKKVAEMVLVLATMGKMRGGGGRGPSKVEVEMMAEARGKLVEVCEGLVPKELFPGEVFGVVIEELGLSRLREQEVGSRGTKMSIKERLLVTKQKMEKSEVFPLHSNTYTPPRLQSNLSGPTEIRGTPYAVRMFPSNKANHEPVSSGSIQNPVHASATNSRSLPYQLPTSEVRPGASSIVPVPRADRSHLRIDGGANGSSAGNTGKTPAWSMQPQSTSFAKMGSVKTDVSSKPVMTKATPDPINVNPRHMDIIQPPAPDTHSEVSKIVQKILHPHALDRPLWTPSSRDYMNKALPCLICKITISEVDTALVCDACERGYHLECLNCNPKAISRGEWQEWHCAKCLTISNGKPLPPKYGRVMRNINTPKLSSSSVTVQFSSDKNLMPSGVNVNDNSFSQSGSGGTTSNSKLTETTSNKNQDHGAGNLVDNRLLSDAPEISSNGKKLETGVNGVIKEDGQDDTLTVAGEHEGPTSSSMNEVQWVGGAIRETDGKTYYNSCFVNGIVYKVEDYAVFSYASNRHLPNKLQTMWEDSKTSNKWVTVTRCFFPDDLPEGVGRPCAPESNEVYESNHETTLMAGLINGPCEVLPPSKFSEESERSKASDRPKPLFLCKWFYDETKTFVSRCYLLM